MAREECYVYVWRFEAKFCNCMYVVVSAFSSEWGASVSRLGVLLGGGGARVRDDDDDVGGGGFPLAG